MMRCFGIFALRLAILLILIRPAFCDEPVSVPPDHAERAKKGAALFKSSVRETLTKHCLDCHGGKSVKGKFDLSTRESLMASGFVKSSADDSQLMKLITHAAKPHMPYKKPKLLDDKIEEIANWINLGAPYDGSLLEKSTTSVPEMQVKDKDREFWSFRPLQPITPPTVQDAGWCRTPIDQFVRARQEAQSLTPNPPADRRILIRRAYFDVLGLPPTPEQVDAFVNDQDSDAWPKLLDQLLASPQYGERWARHWMDVARFAESHGYEQDYDRPNAYHYRDFLIRALNDDMPYDKFVQWQLAGDELAPSDPLAMMATGFLAAGAFPTQLTEADFESARYDELDDMVMTTGVAFLGLSVGCARCHDHKFDPIPSRDYYRMAATFTTAIRAETDIDLSPQENAKRRSDFESQLAARNQAAAEYANVQLPAKFRKWLATAPSDEAQSPEIGDNGPEAAVVQALDELRQNIDENSDAWTTALAWFATSDAELISLRQAVADLEKQGPGLHTAKVMVTSEGLPPMSHHADDRGFPHFYPETHLLKRGDVHQKQELVSAGFLQVLTPAGVDPAHWQVNPPTGWTRTSFRRATLANWLTDSKQGAGGLAARVVVNRLWQHHFGRGLVATPNDFGISGERPSHPELLDWLASDLIAHDWKLKRIHKLIMTSQTYMQSGAHDEARAGIDRENVFLWRRGPRRLEAEAIRDSLLAVSGKLDLTQFGPGTLDQNMTRRSVYFFIKRSQLIPMMMLFDWPEHLVSIGQRPVTTIAPQALMFLNSPQGRDYSSAFAARLSADTPADTIRDAWRLAYGRAPTEQELFASEQFLIRQQAAHAEAGEVDAKQQAIIDFCQTLFSMNEFVYVE